jgi:DNA-directed RNA polymerase subunit M
MTPKDEKGKKILVCACGHSNKGAASKSSVITEKATVKRDLYVMSETDTTLPLTEEICPECGHGHAFWWTKQMRASDEPETKFLRCEKCKHTWRDRG